MEIYRLSGRGRALAHNYRNPPTPEWGVIHFLNKRGMATKEQIYENVPGASSATLAKLRIKRIIAGETGVSV